MGSATRPHRDRLSDLDIEIVVEDDAYAKLPPGLRHRLVVDDGPPRRVDHEFYLWPWSEFEGLVSSRLDLFHHPYQYAVVLSDPHRRIAPVIEALARLPDAVLVERLRVHLLEFLFGVGRVKKTWSRQAALDARLVAADALGALVKLLFLACGSWAAPRHWSGPELRGLGVPDALLDRLGQALCGPDAATLTALVEDVKAWLDERGHTFHHDLEELAAWIHLRPEGRRAFARWGGR